MKTALVILTLLPLVVAASVASADRGYSAYVQQAYKQQQAQQMKAEQDFGKIAAEVEKSLPKVVFPAVTGYGKSGKTTAPRR